MLKLCNSPLPEESKAILESVQSKSFSAVTRHIVKEIITPNEAVRKQVSMHRILICDIQLRYYYGGMQHLKIANFEKFGFRLLI